MELKAYIGGYWHSTYEGVGKVRVPGMSDEPSCLSVCLPEDVQSRESITVTNLLNTQTLLASLQESASLTILGGTRSKHQISFFYLRRGWFNFGGDLKQSMSVCEWHQEP